MKIKPVDVAQLSARQVSTLLALGETHPAVPAAGNADELGLLDRLDEDDQKTLLADLQSPVPIAETGPLSFLRLTGASIDDAQELEGKSFLQALTSSRTSREALDQLCAFGTLLATSGMPAATRRAGTAIRSISRLALHTRFGAELEPLDARRTASLVQSLAATRTAPKRLRDFAQRSAERPEPKS